MLHNAMAVRFAEAALRHERMLDRRVRADHVEPHATVARGGKPPDGGAAWQMRHTRRKVIHEGRNALVPDAS
jgi:hypothetical protein